MKYCPAAWVINYTNPMTLCTATLYAAEPGIKAFGCCHEVFGTQVRLAWLVKEHFGVSERPARQSIKTDVAGVNHFTFALNPTWEGEDLVPLVRRHLKRKDFRRDWSDWAREQKMRGEFFGSKVQVAWDFFERFGALGAAGDRHLVEFVPWYCTSEENLHRKGVLMTPSSYRLGTWQPPQNAPAEKAPGKRKEGLRGSGEEGVQQMLAICGIEPIDTNVNLPNQGQMPDMPLGAVVETNAQFRHDRVTPVVTPPLPSGVAALVRRVVEVQEMTLEAALHRDRDQAFAALLNDPLCTIPVDRAWKMFREMLRANKAMLPGWRV
jgi:alpha-galactosidase